MSAKLWCKYEVIFKKMLILVIVVTFLGCKSTRRNPIPNIPFDITINITLPAYIDLQNVGSYAYVTGGSKGLVVYRMSYDLFVAFDRHSPAEASFNCDQPLTPREENFLELSDSCSTARFSLLDGSAIEGSDVGLRQYLTHFDGANKVRIYN